MTIEPRVPPAVGGAVTYRGPVRLGYRPRVDGQPDAGEVVWAWVSFEEDASIGKDRPLVLIGWADGGRLAGLPMSSRDHAGDRGWLRIGPGPWDRDGRQSWARLDRVLAIAPDAVRREGAVMPRPVFDRLVDALTRMPGSQVFIQTAPRRGFLGRLRSLLSRR